MYTENHESRLKLATALLRKTANFRDEMKSDLDSNLKIYPESPCGTSSEL